MPSLQMPRRNGFTLIEAMVVIAIVAIIAALAGPSFGDMIKMQRLRGISDALATDVAFTRSEAVSRGAYTHLRVQTGSGLSCYVIWARPDPSDAFLCDCTQVAGSRCSGTNTEIKTVVVPSSQAVSFSTPSASVQRAALIINPRNGGVWTSTTSEGVTQAEFRVDTAIDSARTIRAAVVQSGRVLLCAPSGSSVNIQSC